MSKVSIDSSLTSEQTIAALRARVAELEAPLRTESPTRSFIVSIGFSAYLILATVVNIGIATGHLQTPAEAALWVGQNWFPTLLSLIANPAPFYRFHQSLQNLKKEYS